MSVRVNSITMKLAARKLLLTAGVAVLSSVSMAQIPDLINALDAGGRAMGLGGGTYTAGSDTLSSYNNPAGLGFLTEPQFSIVFRNLPDSDTTVSRDFNNPQVATTSSAGSRAVTHLGLVFPIGKREGKTNGSIGLAFTTGGYIRDFRTGNNLQNGDLTVVNYAELLKVKNDFLTLSYGSSAESGFSFGFGLVVAQTSVVNRQDYGLVDSSGTDRGSVHVDNDETATGVGGIVGFTFVPKDNPKVSMGFSYRTPINLSGNNAVKAYYDKVPARLSGGFAGRVDGVRGGKDFLIYGVQGDAYFRNSHNTIVTQKQQFVIGGGMEYNYQASGFRLPIRFGYNAVPSGGDGFAQRNTFTFGLGYYPSNSGLGVDLNFGSPGGGGGLDLAFGITYKFGK